MIQQGKKDLSLGYRCIYEKAAGVFQGQPYDYIQRKLRGNHLALVNEARCDVAVLDHQITFDHFDLTLDKGDSPMTEEEKKAKEKETADKKAMDEAAEKEKSEKEAADKRAKDESEEKEKKEKEAKDAEEKADKEKKDGMDAAEIKRLGSELADLKKNGIKTLMTEITARDTLAKDLSHHIGTFDHADKTLDEVAAYGVEKLGITCESGQERAVLTGFLAGAKRKPAAGSFGMDSKITPKSSEISAYIKQSA